MPGKSMMEPLFCVRQLVENYREKKKKLCMVFIDLEKAYDKVEFVPLWETEIILIYRRIERVIKMAGEN